MIHIARLFVTAVWSLGLVVIATSTAAETAETGAGPAMLRRAVIVPDEKVRLGDIFINAGPMAETTVVYAPPPGRKAVLDARWLYRLAHAYGVDWRPVSLAESVTVERESIAIGRDEAQTQVLAALADRGIDVSDMAVEMGNRMFRMHVAADAATALGVEDLVFDPRAMRFSAVLAAPADDPRAQRAHITGRLHRMVEVPVLNRRVLGGEVITAADVEWTRRRAERLQRNVLIAAEDVIGMTPRRGLRVGMPIRASDLQRPVQVPKGQVVTIVYRQPRMTLTAQGRALEAGSTGDTIRVSNAQSSLVIEAVVAGAGQVVARPMTAQLTN